MAGRSSRIGGLVEHFVDAEGQPVVTFKPSVEPSQSVALLLGTLGIRIDRSLIVADAEWRPHNEGRLELGYAAQDYRASRARAYRRRDLGEAVEVCPDCQTEIDVKAPIHSARCKTVVRDIPVPSGEVSSGAGGKRQKWTRESAIAAVEAFFEVEGRRPVTADCKGSELPSVTTAIKLFGSWASMVEDAGFERPTRGTRMTDARARRARPVSGGADRRVAGGDDVDGSDQGSAAEPRDADGPADDEAVVEAGEHDGSHIPDGGRRRSQRAWRRFA